MKNRHMDKAEEFAREIMEVVEAAEREAAEEFVIIGQAMEIIN